MERSQECVTILDSELYCPKFDPVWESYALYDLAEWINGIAFRNIHFSPNGKPVIKIAEIKNGIIGQTKFTQGEYDPIYHVTGGDMLFSWSGQPETSIDVFRWRGPDGWLNQHIFKVYPKKDCDEAYLFYLLKYLNPNFIRIARNKQTTGLGHVTKRDLQNIKISLPSLSEQRAITYILGSLDDKIELNRQMNKTLEAMAQAIFKSWFVNFDPVRAKAEGRDPGLSKEIFDLFPDSFADSNLGKIPKGWNYLPLTNKVILIGGGTPKTNVKEYWGGNIPWFSVVDAPNESDIFVVNTEKHITQLGVDNSSTKVLRKGTTIISARGTVGKCALVGRPMAMNQSCYGIQGKNSLSDYFVYFTIRRQVADLQRSGHGSVFNTITRDTFRTIQFACPPDNLTISFDNMLQPILELILSRLNENETLFDIRDTLLPKLISGRLRVPDTEKIIKEAGV